MMRAGDLDDIGLALGEEAQLEQLGAELIADARQIGEEAAVDQRIGEAVRGRAGEPMRADSSASLIGPSITLSSMSSPRISVWLPCTLGPAFFSVVSDSAFDVSRLIS
jgi:hypothetical protein